MHRTPETRARLFGFLLLMGSLLSASPASAQQVGQVVAQDGSAEVLRAGTANWLSLTLSDAVFLHDELRTLADSKLQVRFQDDSVLTLAEKTHLRVDEQIVKPAAPSTSFFSLLTGKLRVFVTDRYKQQGAKFEVETPTAVAGVRGTEFIISYPWPGQIDVTRIIGVEDRTQGHSLAVPGSVVALLRQLFTDCPKTQACTPPQLLPPEVFEACLKATTIDDDDRVGDFWPWAAGTGIIGLGVGLGLELDGDGSSPKTSNSPATPVMSGTQ